MKKYIVSTVVLVTALLLSFDDAFALAFDNTIMMQGSGGAGGGNVFATIGSRMFRAVKDLRVLAYIIAGFGMIAFTWGAIFNKISWKHFGNIMFSLFILSMMIPLIEMVVYDGGSSGKLDFDNQASYTANVPNSDMGGSNDVDNGGQSVPSSPAGGGSSDGSSSSASASDGGDGSQQSDAAALETSSPAENDMQQNEKKSFAEKLADARQKTADAAQKVRDGINTVLDPIRGGITTVAAVGSTIKGVVQAGSNISQAYKAAGQTLNDPNASFFDKANSVLGAATVTSNQGTNAYFTGLNSATTITGVFTDPNTANMVYDLGQTIYSVGADVPNAALNGGNETSATISHANSTVQDLGNTINDAANANW